MAEAEVVEVDLVKEAVLDAYDGMGASIRSGVPYVSPLNPPPGPPADGDGRFIPMAEWDPKNWPKHIHRPRCEEGSGVGRESRERREKPEQDDQTEFKSKREGGDERAHS
jgi:hypothetical protein